MWRLALRRTTLSQVAKKEGASSRRSLLRGIGAPTVPANGCFGIAQQAPPTSAASAASRSSPPSSANVRRVTAPTSLAAAVFSLQSHRAAVQCRAAVPPMPSSTSSSSNSIAASHIHQHRSAVSTLGASRISLSRPTTCISRAAFSSSSAKEPPSKLPPTPSSPQAQAQAQAQPQQPPASSHSPPPRPTLLNATRQPALPPPPSLTGGESRLASYSAVLQSAAVKLLRVDDVSRITNAFRRLFTRGRPATTDQLWALLTWLVFGTTFWIVVGTTSAISLLLWGVNTFHFQGTSPPPIRCKCARAIHATHAIHATTADYLGKQIGNYLTYSTGLSFAFESALVPNWKNRMIRLQHVRLSRTAEEAGTSASIMNLSIDSVDVKLSLLHLIRGRLVLLLSLSLSLALSCMNRNNTNDNERCLQERDS